MKYYIIKIIEEDKDLIENFLQENESEFADFFEVNKKMYDACRESKGKLYREGNL